MKQHRTSRPRPHRSGLALSALAFAVCLSLAGCDDRGSAATGLPAPAVDALPPASGKGGAGGSAGSGAGGSGGSTTDAEMKCRNLFLALCAKDTACGTSPALTATECLAQFQTNCAQVMGVSDGYDACMSSIPVAPCPIFDNLPTACNKVLLN